MLDKACSVLDSFSAAARLVISARRVSLFYGVVGFMSVSGATGLRLVAAAAHVIPAISF